MGKKTEWDVALDKSSLNKILLSVKELGESDKAWERLRGELCGSTNQL